MEDKLNEYRVRKRRQEVISNIKERFFKMMAGSKSDVAINLNLQEDDGKVIIYADFVIKIFLR